jgi:hypothetical protein
MRKSSKLFVLLRSVKNTFRLAGLCAAAILLTIPQPVQAQRRGAAGPPTLGLTNGYLELESPDFNFKLVKDSQTLAALTVKNADGFNFIPTDQLEARQANRFYQFGDLTFRLRTNSADAWANYSTAAARQPVAALPAAAPALASADLAATLPGDCPLQVIRTWTVENGRLVLRFDVKNKLDVPMEIGALGIPLIFNNNAGYNGNKGRVQSMSAFSDPVIGLDGGYVQVTRLNGHGPALVVVPDGKTPLEAYEPLQSDKIGDLTPLSQPGLCRERMEKRKQPVDSRSWHERGLRLDGLENFEAVEHADLGNARARSFQNLRAEVSPLAGNSRHYQNLGRQ